MALFKYQAKDREGKVYERTAEVSNRYDVYGLIREEGGTVVSIHEIKKFTLFNSFKNLLDAINTHQKITFAKNLGLMMEAGLSVTRALSVMSRQSQKKPFKKLVKGLE